MVVMALCCCVNNSIRLLILQNSFFEVNGRCVIIYNPHIVYLTELFLPIMLTRIECVERGETFCECIPKQNFENEEQVD